MGKEGKSYCTFRMDKYDANWEINYKMIGTKMFSVVLEEMQKL